MQKPDRNIIVFFTMGLWLLVPLTFSACPRKGQKPGSLPVKWKKGETKGVDLEGVWDWNLELVTDDGDFRVEKESWLLQRESQHQISGTYRRRVTVISRDGKPFECNGEKSYQLEAEFKVVGKIRKGVLFLKEKSVNVVPGPCEKGQRRLDGYQGKIIDGKLVLRWKEGQQSLNRRDLTGVWVGKKQRTLSNGDSSLASEIWYIVQKGKNSLRGELHRMDVRYSNDKKPYRCNGRLHMGRFVVWSFRGKMESGFAQVEFGRPFEKKNPCENRNLKQKSGRLIIGYDKDKLTTEIEGFKRKLRRQGGLFPFLAGR